MKAPIYDAVRKYWESKPTPFHMPGHKLGTGLPLEFLQNIHRMDVTEIPGTDNLHYPQEAIKEAQELAAKAFGAQRTFFLINGSTCGIHAMIMTVCKPGDKLIVSRDCHKSVINGMILAGAEPVYIRPEFDTYYGISTVITPSDIEQAIRSNPEAAGVLITRPNYYGVCSDMKAISQIVHSHGKVLMVDEAHGAHLKFSPSLPACAMESGADICVQSAHKTLLAFTQGAYLHVGSSRLDMERLEFNLRLLQTTSPSYIIMSSLDVARAEMQERGEGLIEALLHRIGRFKEKVDSNPELPLDIFGEELHKQGRMDGTRLVINVRRLGKTGFEIERLLRQHYNIQVEMSDMYNIVCICTVSDSEESFERLYEALCHTAKKFKGREPLADKRIISFDIPPRKMSLREVTYSHNISVGLREAVGRISGGTITPYPPGIPIVCPGEILLQEIVEYIYTMIDSGGIINGLGKNFEVNVAV